MSNYTPPLEDIDFVLNHVVDLSAVSKLNGFQHADPATVSGLLAEAGRFFSEVIAPLNPVGDRQGSVLQPDGSVKTPDGFREAYRKYVEAGWGGAHIEERWGGGGLPYTVGIVLQEMFKTANMAFSLCPMLTQAAIESLIEHGSDEQRAIYLEKLVSGTWTGTMCLTEPHAGSDVGALSTRAVPAADGTYRITGQKIFITWGDHDLTENLVHLVLARTPGAAPGTKGISMFLVPKFLPTADGRPGARNDVKIVSLEHKLGIHASPTCVVSFGDSGEGAIGFLVGEEQRGMKYMFTMMNTARIGVGIEGLAIGERAYQQALAYALERRQGRAAGAPVTESLRIVDHPDVRRMLLTMRAYNEAMRCLLYTTANQVDFERHGEDEMTRQRAGDLVALLTPVTKAWNTDLGVELASLGLQVHGGMGYVEETGAAQHFRDSRIAPIYEGTNGIQAIDLVTRKLPLRGGEALRAFLGMVEETVAEMEDAPDLAESRVRLAAGLAALSEAGAVLGRMLAAGRLDDALAGATPYLRMFGLVTGGWLMARSALAAGRLLAAGSGDPAWLEAKLTTARFFCEQLLPQAEGLAPAIGRGAAPLFAITPEMLGR
jgi:alkylation response protein AidB-like acyl-CoA dehydrogenase